MTHPRTFNIMARYVRLNEAVVSFTRYRDGSPAMLATGYSEDGPEQEVVSVNLTAYGLIPDEGNVFVPDYSENEGLPAALVAAGVGTIVREFEFGPHSTKAVEFKPNEEVRA
jgi:hypothetical protein